jgi:serine protease inhibitor
MRDKWTKIVYICIGSIILLLLVALYFQLTKNTLNKEIAKVTEEPQQHFLEPISPDFDKYPDSGDQGDTISDERGKDKRIKNLNSNIEASIEVTDRLARMNSGENVMFSPTSLNFALGLLQEGADKKAKNAIDKYLNTNNYKEYAKSYLESVDEINQRTVDKLEKVRDWENLSDEDIYNSKTIHIANSIWINKNSHINDSYIENLENNYRATADKMDVNNPEEAAKKINNWTNENTFGLIKEMVKPGEITPDTQAVLANSVYFCASWSDKWWAEKYENGDDALTDFTIKNGNETITEKVCYMDNDGNTYYENKYATAFSCHYNVYGLEFIGILPKKEGDFELSDLDINGLLSTGTTKFDELNIKMPKLNYETDIEVKEILMDMGYKDLFSDSYSKIGDGVVLDNIFQKTKLELDEEKTCAAAVTMETTTLGATFAPIFPKIYNVYLTRPFAFLIYDFQNDEVLFIGKVVTTK